MRITSLAQGRKCRGKWVRPMQEHFGHNYVGYEIIVLSTNTAMTASNSLAFNVHQD